ncbi:hypothetical protein GCM10010399_85690 [Dactylosporangium fulvum]|uniref:Plasmid replication, integration and excision activator n=1 Tax=Dactylosporangium fulvum TaxID=53359 RepID=A0ABY5VX28_9ACTN|nr:hypothetical protein [Dactylosporangium fulvum]UWP81681.1 hypothetical protein Dfulv_42330 [Dactylosporangium fulvum]
MLPNSVRYPVPFEYAFPAGALFLGVDKQTDFDKLREDDNQARDEHGVRLWVVTVIDQDPEATKFGRSPQVKVKIAAAHQPVPPAPIQVAGMSITPVAFTDLMVTPYTDTSGCKGDRQPHRCRARLAWSYRASGIVAPAEFAAAAAA